MSTYTNNRGVRVCGLTQGNAAIANAPDNCVSMYCLVHAVDVNGVTSQPIAWMSIMCAVAPKGEIGVIQLSWPPFVSHVIRGFTLTLPPLEPRAGC